MKLCEAVQEQCERYLQDVHLIKNDQILFCSTHTEQFSITEILFLLIKKCNTSSSSNQATFFLPQNTHTHTHTRNFARLKTVQAL